MLLNSILKDKTVYLLKEGWFHASYALIFDKQENDEEEKLVNAVNCTIQEIEQNLYKRPEGWEVKDLLQILHEYYNFQEVRFDKRQLCL